MRLLLKVAVYAAAVWLAVRLVGGLDFDGTALTLIAVAVVLGVVNAVVKPIVKLLSLPLVVVTLGLFLLVVNALMLQLTVWLSGQLDLGLTSEGFGATFLGAIVISIVSWIGEHFLDRD